MTFPDFPPNLGQTFVHQCLDLDWQIFRAACKTNNVPFVSCAKYSFTPSIREENLRNFVPNVVEPIDGDGNCYFSTISFILSGSKCHHELIRGLIVDKMLNILKVDCNTFLRSKCVYQQGNYRNIQDWVNKTRMNKIGSWATDLEIFATALLLKTDIWVFLGQGGTRWVGFSGCGYNLDTFLQKPTSNGIYIRNLGCHYEPILSVKLKPDISPSNI